MNILAIDQARHGGWSVYDYETKTLKYYGTFDFSGNQYTYAQAILEIEKLIKGDECTAEKKGECKEVNNAKDGFSALAFWG